MKRKSLYIFSLLFGLICLFTASIPFTFGVQAAKNKTSAEETSTSSEMQSTSTFSVETPSANLNITPEDKEYIQAWVWRIVKRFQTAMNRLAKIADRIESRTEKLKNPNTKVTAEKAEKEISKARKNINSAGDNIILAAAEIKQIFKGASPMKTFKKFEGYVQNSKENIRKSVNSLNKSLKILETI